MNTTLASPASSAADTPAATAPAFWPAPQHLVLGGAALGLAAGYLLWNGPTGPGLLVWLLLLAGTAAWLGRAAGMQRLRMLALWSATAVAAALLLVLRDLPILIPAMWLVILAAAVLTLLEASGVSLRTARLGDHLRAAFRLPLNVLSLAPRLLGRIDLNHYTRNPRLSGLLRGTVLALPLLAIFIALFAAADATFNRYAMQLTGLFSADSLQYLLMAAVYGWIATGLLASACLQPSAAALRSPRQLRLGTLEAGIILGLTSALFVLFVLLQLGYLFGGAETIERTSGLTLAQYARRGFFELLMVAGLTLALLLGLGATDCDRRVFRRFGTILVACVLIILVSAAQRLWLYTTAFGLTVDRFNALAVMLWQACNLLAFAATVLRERVEAFASMLVISGIATLLLLALVNPAAVVTRINLERALAGEIRLDSNYLMSLGSDAVPVLLDHYDALPASAQCEIAWRAVLAYPVATDGNRLRSQHDWRNWNASRAAAQGAVDARRSELDIAAAARGGQLPVPLPGLPRGRNLAGLTVELPCRR